MSGDALSEIERRARDRLLSEHDAFLRAVGEAAISVTDDGSDWQETDGSSPRTALAQELADRGLIDRVPDVLTDICRSTGLQPAASPVPAPPYVTVSGTAVVLRIPMPTFRVVITIRTFSVDRRPPRYRPVRSDPTERLEVSIHR